MPRYYNPESMNAPFNPYTHGVEVHPEERMVFFAGQVGSNQDGSIEPDFEGQIRQLYRNIEAVLKDADMGLNDLVKLTTYLVSRDDLDDMRRIRKEILGDHKPAHTLLLISGLAFPEFLIEVEGFAAK